MEWVSEGPHVICVGAYGQEDVRGSSDVEEKRGQGDEIG